MSLEAASQNLPGVPEDLIMRSAQARATAQGVSVDDVLASWAGGASLPASEAAEAPAEPAPEPEQVAEPAAQPEPTAQPAAAATATPAPAPAPAAEVVWVLPEEPEPVEPAALGERLRSGALVGLVLGAVIGIVAGALTFAAAGEQMLVTEDGPAVAVDPTRAMIIVGLIFAAAGLVVARVAAALPARFREDHALEFRGGVVGTAGTLLGGALGVVTAAMLTGGGVEITGQEPLVAVAATGVFVTTAIMAAISGTLVGAAAQALTMPKGLDPDEAEDSETVRRRLSTGYLVPIVILVSMALVIVGVGTVFLEFPAFAPVIAIVVAGAILSFGFLATSRPNMEIGSTEVAVFFTGLAIIVIFMAAVAFQIGGGHGEESDHGDDGDDHAAVQVGLL